MNQGLEIACGAYLVILDVDDHLTSQALNLRYDSCVDEESRELFGLTTGGWDIPSLYRTYSEKHTYLISDLKQLHEHLHLW